MEVKTRLNELWKELLEQKPTNDDLRYIIKYIEPLRKEAQKLLKRPKAEILEDMKYLV